MHGRTLSWGHIRDNESKIDWLRESTLTWEKNIGTISKTVRKCPQESYGAVLGVIQLEWIFIQRVTWYTGGAFAGVEKIIQKILLPRLFFGNTKTLSPIVGALGTMPIKLSGLGLLNPVISANYNCQFSQWGSVELIRAVTGGGAFYNTNHLRALGEEICDRQKYRGVENETKIKGLVQDLKVTDRRLILRSNLTGAWMSVYSTTVSGAVFPATEFCDFLYARYNVSP